MDDSGLNAIESFKRIKGEECSKCEYGLDPRNHLCDKDAKHVKIICDENDPCTNCKSQSLEGQGNDDDSGLNTVAKCHCEGTFHCKKCGCDVECRCATEEKKAQYPEAQEYTFNERIANSLERIADALQRIANEK